MERRTKLIIPPDAIATLRDAVAKMKNAQPETGAGPLAAIASDILELMKNGWSDAAIATWLTDALQQAGYDGLIVGKHHIARLRKTSATKTETRAATRSKTSKRSEEAKVEQEAPASTPKTSPLTATNGPRTSRFGQSSGTALDR